MRNLLLIDLIIVFILSVSCSEHPLKKSKLPRDAFPVIYRGHLYVPGTVDSIEGNMVFDTGASNLYLDSTYFAANDFRYADYFTAKLPGAGATPQDVIVIKDTVTFRFGRNKYETAIVPVLQLKPILGDIADGILGMDYFQNSVLEINYEQEFMRIFPNIDSVDLTDYYKVEFVKRGNRLFVPMEITINDTLGISGEFQMDFGSGGTVTFTSSASTTYNLANSIVAKTLFYTKYGGVGGESSSYDFMSASLKIGKFTFSNVIMNFSIDTKGALTSNEHLGLLGNGIYKRFNLYIDFIHNDLYLTPNDNYHDPFEFSRLGFSYVDRHRTLKSWIVTGLYNGSNAETSGLQIDDKIVSVNGTNIESIDYVSQEKFIKDIPEARLIILRGEETKEINFKLQSIQ